MYLIADCRDILQKPTTPKFDLIVTSPPYGIGLEYEDKMDWVAYYRFAESWIRYIGNVLKINGSLWLNVGCLDGHPLAYLYYDLLRRLTSLVFVQEIIWEFPSGGAARNKFSRRHETWLWYAGSKDYKFNLDAIRTETQYAQDKRNNPLGKNPGTVWYYQQMRKTEGKTEHPCEFPLEMIQRIIKACSDPGDMVLDPFAGSGTVGIACHKLDRRYMLIDREPSYEKIFKGRLNDL